VLKHGKKNSQRWRACRCLWSCGRHGVRSLAPSHPRNFFLVPALCSLWAVTDLATVIGMLTHNMHCCNATCLWCGMRGARWPVGWSQWKGRHPHSHIHSAASYSQAVVALARRTQPELGLVSHQMQSNTRVQCARPCLPHAATHRQGLSQPHHRTHEHPHCFRVIAEVRAARRLYSSRSLSWIHNFTTAPNFHTRRTHAGHCSHCCLLGLQQGQHECGCTSWGNRSRAARCATNPITPTLCTLLQRR
jgi:hypothetical protein